MARCLFIENILLHCSRWFSQQYCWWWTGKPFCALGKRFR